jgi:hypothetical protein
MPNDKVRAAYLRNKFEDLSDEEIKSWGKATKSFSFGALADLVVSVKCLDVPFEKAVKTLKELMKLNGVPTDSSIV